MTPSFYSPNAGITDGHRSTHFYEVLELKPSAFIPESSLKPQGVPEAEWAGRAWLSLELTLSLIVPSSFANRACSMRTLTATP